MVACYANIQTLGFPSSFFAAYCCVKTTLEHKKTNIILATMPKVGTTWLKALLFSIINRHLYSCSIHESPLLTSISHNIIPCFESKFYPVNVNPNLENFPSPRIFATHMPYSVLPNSILESRCKIIYICRNPLEQFISHRDFVFKNWLQVGKELLSLDEAFKMYCNGIQPFWNNMLEYWNASFKNPDTILFLKCKDLKEDTILSLKKMAEFVGKPFSIDEEEKVMLEEIMRLCSLENLKSLNVNKEEKLDGVIMNSLFYRKGEVGDWKNHLNTSMVESIEKILEEKLSESGLTFERYIKYS